MIEQLKDWLGLFVVVPAIFAVGLYLTIRLRGMQILSLPRACRLVLNTSSEQAMSSFAAFAAVIGGNLGTGNIAGIAVALKTGGPGALFWMWIMALLGAIIKFVGCYLAVLFRSHNAQGYMVGGPMYYLRDGLGKKYLAIIYCVVTLIAALTVGNWVQVNSLALPLKTIGVPAWFTGLLLAFLIAWVTLRGVRSFIGVTTKLVPFMAVLYIASCVYILVSHYQLIFPALELIVQSAFQGSSLVGGALGVTAWQAIRVGFDRGLFATDAGVGIAPILHAQVKSQPRLEAEALHQGLVSLVAPVVVMLICMLTGCVLLVTGAWTIESAQSTNVCIQAFIRGFDMPVAGHLVTITLSLFAFTTMMTWSHCAEKALEFLLPIHKHYWFKILFIAFIPLGAMASVSMVWSVADIALNLMLLLNLLGVAALSARVIQSLRQTQIEPTTKVTLDSAIP